MMFAHGFNLELSTLFDMIQLDTKVPGLEQIRHTLSPFNQDDARPIVHRLQQPDGVRFARAQTVRIAV
jgi:hypothetical protein